MTLGIVVLAHTNPDQLAWLLARLEHPRTRLYLHVDRRSPWEAFRRALDETGPEQLTLLPRRASRWGGIESVDATLDGLEGALEDGCGYVVLLSGQDAPLWPVERTVEFFADAGERSYVEHFPLPDDRWRLGGCFRTEFYTFTVRGRRETCVPRGVDVHMSWKGKLLNWMLRLRTAFLPPRRFPSYVEPYGGSQWWNLSRPAAEHVVEFVREHPDYREYHEHTLVPDEIFFQSILLGTPYAEAHQVVNDSLRHMVWEEDASHPRTLTRDDLPAAMESGKPFARKLDASSDPGILERLDELS